MPIGAGSLRGSKGWTPPPPGPSGAKKRKKAKEEARLAALEAATLGIAKEEAENDVTGSELIGLSDSEKKLLSDEDWKDAPAATAPVKRTTSKDIPVTDPLDPITAARMAALRVKYRRAAGPDGLRSAIMSCLPQPHAKQKLIEDSPAKRKVVNVGRRGGKTTLAARVAIIKMCESRRVLLASTTQDQADAFWEKCKVWLQPFIESGEIEKNETKRILFMPSTGGRIKVKTASDADMLRGDYADFLVLDECALLAPNAWNEVGAPMLLDNDGDAWFLSTPRRRNWFFHLYQRAVADDTGRWQEFHFTSFDNPHLSEDALAEITKDLTDEAYKQEILAVFLEGEGAVFRNIAANMVADPLANPHDHRLHFVVAGLDWGQKHDYTAMSIFCATCMRELYLDRFNRVDYGFQRDRVVNLCRTWYVKHVLAELNSIGVPNIEVLVNEEKLPVDGFDTQKNTKPLLIRAFSLALERRSADWIDVPVATGELEAYEAIVSKRTGHVAYEAPSGLHDDTVIARCLAYHDALTGLPPDGPSATSYANMVVPEAMNSADMPAHYENAPGWISYSSGPAAGYNHAIGQYTDKTPW